MNLKSVFLWFCLLAGLLAGACSDDDDEGGLVLPQAELSWSPLQKLIFPSGNTELKLQLTASASWKITGLPEWLHALPASGDAGECEVAFTADENTADVARTVRLKVMCGGRTFFLPARQLAVGDEGALDFEQKEIIIDEQEQKLNISYTYSTEPEVVIPDAAKSWLTLVKTKAVQKGVMVFKVAANTGQEARTAEVVAINREYEIRDTLKITQNPAISYKEPDVKEAFVLAEGGEKVLEVACNVPLKVVFPEGTTDFPSWMKLVSNEVKEGKAVLKFSFEPNTSENVRDFSFRLECSLVPELGFNYAFQQGFSVKDMTCVTLHRRTKTPVNPNRSTDIVFTGDGFNQQDIENGTFDRLVRRAYKSLFECEPYKSLKDYFSAYMIYAISHDAGIPEHSKFTDERLDTRYGIYYNESQKMRIACDYKTVYTLVESAVKEAGNEFVEDGSCVVMVANDTSHVKAEPRGICYIFNGDDCPGAVAICPLKDNKLEKFDYMVRHEAGGHGYGKLADEYDGFGNTTIDQSGINKLAGLHEKDWYMNVACLPFGEWWIEGNFPWYNFQPYRERYPQIGIFEGGNVYRHGVYRSTYEGIMRDDEPKHRHHSVFCRYLIWKRVMETFGEDTSVETFVAQDYLKYDDELLPGYTHELKPKSKGVPYRQETRSCIVRQD